MADDQDNTRGGGAVGPYAHAARHEGDDLNAEGRGQQKP